MSFDRNIYLYCPSCGAEYHQGVSECSDCGVGLVRDTPTEDEPAIAALSTEGTPPESWMSKFEPVCVAELNDEMEAEIILSVFRAHDVRAYPTGRESRYAIHHGALTTPVAHLGSIRIMVHPEDEVIARGLLEMAEVAEEEDLLADESLDYADDALDAFEDPVESIGDLGTPPDAVYSGAPLAAPAPGRGLLIAVSLAVLFTAAVALVLWAVGVF